MFLGLVVLLISIPAQGTPLQASLLQKRSLLEDLLLRVENGRAPCFTAVCQQKKREILEDIVQVTDRLPDTSQDFLRARNEGLLSAHSLLRASKRREHALEASTTFDLREAWRRRASFDLRDETVWLNFQSQIHVLADTYQMASDLLIRSESPHQELRQEAWSRGLGRAAELTVEASALMEKSSQAQGSRARELHAKALQLTEEREKIEALFGNQLSEVVEELFPEKNFSKTLFSLALLQKAFRQKNLPDTLTDPKTVAFVEQRMRLTKTVSQKTQDWTDLEFGVIGLKNFSSPINRAAYLEAELPQQEFLDQVENRARMLIEFSATWGLLKIGLVIHPQAAFAATPLLLIYNFWSLETGKSSADYFLNTKSVSQEIENALPRWQDKMEKREEDLWKVRTALKHKLKDIDERLAGLSSSEAP